MTRHTGRFPVWFIVALVVLMAGIAAALLFGQDWLDGWKSQQTESQARALFPANEATNAPETAQPSEAAQPFEETPDMTPAVSAESTPTITIAPTATPEPTPYHPELPPVATLPPVQADFEALYAQNEDTIGWLTAGERIDYPVAWREGDNDYYLHHDIFGKEDRNGTLFLNGNNRFFPANDVWLIHGHNMRSGAMFGTLHRYRQMSYVRKYPLITFRTIYDAEPVYYVAIAGFDASMMRGNRDYFDITQIAFPDDEEDTPLTDGTQLLPGETVSTPAATATAVPSLSAAEAAIMPSVDTTDTVRHSTAFTEYLASLRKVSLWDSPADVNADDSLLMLVTCSYSQNDGRFILVCRKLREDETPEEVTALFQQ